MGYLQARSGVCRSGVTRCGLFAPSLKIQIAGVTQTPQYESFTITEYLDGSPNQCTFVAQGFAPSEGQEIKVGYGHLDNLIFAGHIISIQYDVQGFEASSDVIYTATAADYSWLLDLHDTVTKPYYTQGVNSIVADILRNNTEGGFQPGALSGLGDLAITFTQATPSAAFQSLAKAVGGYWMVDYRKRVHIFSTWPDANALTIGDATTGIEQFQFTRDNSQLRNRVRVTGRSSTTSAPTGAGGTTIAVTDTTPFLTAGGSALIGQQVVTYTGLSASSGPGLLTGVSGIVNDVAQGDTISVFSQADDTSAQTALAALLGGGVSGIATHYVSDTSLSVAAAQATAQSQLGYFSSAISAISYTTRNTRNAQATFTRPGKTVSVSLTTPTSLVGTFRIQRVEMTFETPVVNNTGVVEITRKVTAQRHYRTVLDLLQKVGG